MYNVHYDSEKACMVLYMFYAQESSGPSYPDGVLLSCVTLCIIRCTAVYGIVWLRCQSYNIIYTYSHVYLIIQELSMLSVLTCRLFADIYSSCIQCNDLVLNWYCIWVRWLDIRAKYQETCNLAFDSHHVKMRLTTILGIFSFMHQALVCSLKVILML